MSQFYGYHCYSSENKPLGWFYTYGSGRDYAWTNNPSDLHWCKRWKTFQGAAKHLDIFNEKWKFGSKGGYLKIEIMPDFEMPVSRKELKRQKWNAANSDTIEESKAEGDFKCPILSFLPTPEIQAWLEEERYCDNGIPETTAALLNRKLKKLRTMENQGY
jgi:hypothetical protein